MGRSDIRCKPAKKLAKVLWRARPTARAPIPTVATQGVISISKWAKIIRKAIRKIAIEITFVKRIGVLDIPFLVRSQLSIKIVKNREDKRAHSNKITM
jgi:hypothetical protein